MSQQNTLNPRLTFWLLAHGVCIAVMIGMVAPGLAEIFGWYAAIPLAIVISFVFATLSDLLLKVSLNFFNLTERKNGILKNTVTLLGLYFGVIFIFVITNAMSYASIYSALVAQESGRSYLKNSVRDALNKLNSAKAAIDGIQTAADALEKHSSKQKNVEQTQGGSCINYPSTQNVRGPITVFREQDELAAQAIKAQISALTEGFLKKLNSISISEPENYSAAVSQMTATNESIREFNGLIQQAFIPNTLNQLELLKNAKTADEKICADPTRLSNIDKAKTAVNQLNAGKQIPLISPGFNFENKKALTLQSLLRGLTLVFKFVPPMSFSSEPFGVKTDFSSDPMMQKALSKDGAANSETMPIYFSIVIEAMVFLTVRLAYRSGSALYPVVNNVSINSLRDEGGLSGICKRLFANLFLRDAKSAPTLEPTAPVGQVQHNSNNPNFENREKDFAKKLTKWFLELESVSLLVILDGKDNECDLIAARVLQVEGLSDLIALNASWNQLDPPLHTFMNRKALDGLWGPDYASATFHIFKLRDNFAQMLRLERLKLASYSDAIR